MNLLDVFRFRKEKSADLAKERLQIIVNHERNQRRRGKINLQELQQKLIQVVAEYLHIDAHDVNVELEKDNERSVLELNVSLPEELTESVRQ